MKRFSLPLFRCGGDAAGNPNRSLVQSGGFRSGDIVCTNQATEMSLEKAP